MTHQTIVVLDFGSQYTQLIARRLRELSVYSEILPPTTPRPRSPQREPVGIIFSGGPTSVSEPGAPRTDPAIFARHPDARHLLRHAAHDRRARRAGREAPHREFGHATVTLARRRAALRGPARLAARLGQPRRLRRRRARPASTSSRRRPTRRWRRCRIRTRRLYGLLFHPRSRTPTAGSDILRNFAFDVCGCTGDWTMTSFVDESIGRIRAQVGDGRVVCGLSGGVDSTVAAVLLHRAHRRSADLHLRGQRPAAAERGRAGADAIRAARTAARVRGRVRSVPRSARRTSPIPSGSARSSAPRSSTCSRQRARELGDFDFLAQGTLYPDVIESVSVVGPSATIKSHHNVGGLPERMRFKLVEPLRELFKDEVRAVGTTLGLDDEFVWRQPFPGPGPGGAAARADHARAARSAAPRRRHRRRRGPEGRLVPALWQSFAVLLPVQSVGVMGDERTYEYTVADSRRREPDGMTADWARLPHDLLGAISSRIVNEVRGINRVVYDISSKPPATIEWEVGGHVPSSSTCTCTRSSRCSTARAGSASCSIGPPS